MERPEALLKGALEKIVYFEARSEQLERDVTALRAETERQRGELAAAAQREIELRRVVAELEVRAARAHSEREDSARVAEMLRRERAELIGKMLEASRISSAGQETPEAHDLAQFIAQLRDEVLVLRRQGDARTAAQATAGAPEAPKAAAPAPVAPQAPAQPSAVARVAAALEAQGRLSVQPSDLSSLTRAQGFGGRTEETLFGFSVRELSAPDAGARIRAAERLKALGHAAAAPALAAALHGESEPKVLEALLQSFQGLAGPEGVPVVEPLVSSTSPAVRMAALKALMALDASQAGPHLAQAVKDPDPAVRRRASLLALSLRGEAAITVGEEALRDGDGEVRALAALVLGASGDLRSRPLLELALTDRELAVRRAAGQSLSRLLGTDVSALVDLGDSERRRAVRRLNRVEAHPVVNAAQRAAPVRVAVAVVEAPVVSESQVLLSLRTAIRGRTLHELAQALSVPEAAALEVCRSLSSQGRVVQRGQKFFVA